jgi:hypothetical protein
MFYLKNDKFYLTEKGEINDNNRSNLVCGNTTFECVRN